MKTAKIVLAASLLGVTTGCARQDSHFIRVLADGNQALGVADCDVFTTEVHGVAGDYRLKETQGVTNRALFPRYRSYWSEVSPIGIDLYCDSNMLQVTVTALRMDRRDIKGTTYKDSIAKLVAAIERDFPSRVEERDDSILVRVELPRF
jgi:hypothetical protein